MNDIAMAKNRGSSWADPVDYPNRIPAFPTEEAAREFWTTHDSARYFKQMDDVTASPPIDLRSRVGPRRPAARRPMAKRMSVISFRMPEEVRAAVKEIAARRHLSYQTLIRSWIGERISEERQSLRRSDNDPQ